MNGCFRRAVASALALLISVPAPSLWAGGVVSPVVGPSRAAMPVVRVPSQAVAALNPGSATSLTAPSFTNPSLSAVLQVAPNAALIAPAAAPAPGRTLKGESAPPQADINPSAPAVRARAPQSRAAGKLQEGRQAASSFGTAGEPSASIESQHADAGRLFENGSKKASLPAGPAAVSGTAGGKKAVLSRGSAPTAPGTKHAVDGDVESSYEKAEPVPEPTIVRSDLASVDDAFDHHVTHSRPGVEGVDPVQFLADYIDGLVAETKAYGPHQKSNLVLKYFEIAHPKVLASIKKAVEAGIPITVLTDINRYFVSPGPESTTDFEHASYKDDDLGQALKYLREQLGFKLKQGEGPFTVLSGEPLFGKTDKENALMHDKVAVALGPDGKIYKYALSGTANMNTGEDKSEGPLTAYGGRFNSLYRGLDPVANQVDWDQATAEAEAFNRRDFLDIHRAHNPIRVVYKDGTFQEIAFTFGKQNINDRITNLLKRAADPANNVKVDEVVFSHYAFTMASLLDSLRKLMADQPALRVFGIFDKQFIGLDGYGVAGALAQFLVQRPMGRSIFPFRSDYEQNMDLYGYQRLKDHVGSVDSSTEYETAHLWHDKTTIVKTQELDSATGKWVAYTYVFTGSFNGSNHFESFESQRMYRFLTGSPKAAEIEDSIKSTVKAEPEYAIPLAKEIVRTWLSQLTLHTPYDIDIHTHVDAVIDAFSKQDFSGVESILKEILEKPSKAREAGETKLDAARARIAQFVKFLNWNAKEAAHDLSQNKMTFRKAVNIGEALVTGDALNMRLALDILYYNPQRPNSQTVALMEKAWTQGLELGKPFPKLPSDEKPDAPPEKAPATLSAEFTEALLRYHRLDGLDDGSGLKGSQFPPIKEFPQGDPEKLKATLSRVALFLGSQPGIVYRPSPADLNERIAQREETAKAATQEIQDHATDDFAAVVDSLRDPKIKAFVQNALQKAQPEFQRAPSSSSRNYHPADEINKGGLLVHSMRNVIVGRLLARYFELTPRDSEIVSAALILHDVAKGGIPWRHDGNFPDSGYDPAHGTVAAQWLETLAPENCGADCGAIIEGVRNHMAQWNKPAPTPPQNLIDQIISYADYLASLDSVYVQWRPSAKPAAVSQSQTGKISG